MTESLKTTIIKNVGYNSLAKIVQMVVMAVANVILTRTLAPSDYGIVGFAGIFTAFLSQFSDLGIGSAVVQKTELDQRVLYTAYTIRFIIGLVLFLLAYIGAPLAVLLFDNPAIVSVIRVIALNFILNTFGMLPSIVLSRKLDFKKISVANVSAAMVNSIVAVALALLGYSYWSLVIAGIVMTLSSVAILNFLQKVPYRFCYDHKITRELLNYGGNIFFANITIFLFLNADNFIIGAVKGASNLGYYSLAFNWGSIVCTLIASTVLSVLFPVYSKIKNDRESLKQSYLVVIQYVSFGGVLINATLFVVSRDFLFLVLGHHSDKWYPALQVLRIFCLYGIVRLMLEPIGQVVMALGRTDMLRKATLITALIEIAGLYPVLYYQGIESVALLVTLALLGQYVLYYRFLKSELDINIKELISRVGPSLLAGTALFLVMLGGELWFGVLMHIFVIKILVCIALYLTVYGSLTKWKIFQKFRGVVIGSA